MTIAQLQDRLSEINEESVSILARAEAEKRNTSPEEDAELDGLLEEFNTTKGTIARLQTVQKWALSYVTVRAARRLLNSQVASHSSRTRTTRTRACPAVGMNRTSS